MQCVLGKNPEGKAIVMVVGGATRDAEVKMVGDSGKSKVTFSLGFGKNKNEENIYANCDAWGNLRGYASTIEKADTVCAIGTIHSYTSPTNGKTYNTLNVEWLNICRKMEVKVYDDGSTGADFITDDEMQAGEQDGDEEDLPF